MKMVAVTLLPLDECEEWISQTLCCGRKYEFEYIKSEQYEYLGLRTRVFFLDRRAIEKIKKITNMILINIHSDGSNSTVLWFGRWFPKAHSQN